MRPIDKIIFHCSASDNPKHDDVDVMRQWHLARGFADVGYHFFITKAGKIQEGRPLTKVGAHTANHNTGSVGVCFHGLNNFTKEQMAAIHVIIKRVEEQVGHSLKLCSHRDFTSAKTCPNFLLPDFLNGKCVIIKKYPAMASFTDLDFDVTEEECDTNSTDS